MAAAVPAVIGAVGAVAAARSSAGAARSAASSQERAAALTAAEQRRQFDISRREFRPFREAGVRAIGEQQALLGLLGQDRQREAFQVFQDSPGQEFLRERGEQALLRREAAIGGLGGGRVREALQQQGIGFAQQDLQNQLARLSALSGTGQAATGTVAGLGSQASGRIGQALTQAGAARAGGIISAGQARQQLITSLTGAGVGASLGAGLGGSQAQQAFGGSAGSGALLGLLSDKNMKEDICDLSPKECFDAVMGLPLKSWRYIEEAGIDRKVHFGPMSQDAPEFIKIDGTEILNVHDELMLIAGAMQHMKQEGMLNG